MALEQVSYDASDGSVAPGQHVEVINCGTATTLVAADSGAICIFDTAANGTFTLPTPVVGMYFDFRFGIKTSGAYKVVTANTVTEFIKGQIAGFTTDVTEVDSFTADGTADSAITMDGSATGGDAGGWIHLVASSTTVWQLTGDLYCGTTAPTDPTATS